MGRAAEVKTLRAEGRDGRPSGIPHSPCPVVGPGLLDFRYRALKQMLETGSPDLGVW